MDTLAYARCSVPSRARQPAVFGLPQPARVFIALGVYVALMAVSCGPRKPAEPPKEYPLRGEVVRLDPQVRTAAIKHGKIEGWMEAMTMEFPVRETTDFEKLAVGRKITATVYVTADGYWIGNIQPAPPNP